MTTTKWIDLRDSVDRAKLKVATQHSDDGRVRRFLFIVGLSQSSVRWQMAIDRLGFVASPKGKYLSRLVAEGERIQASSFRPVWPNATLAEMSRDEAVLNLTPVRRAVGLGTDDSPRKDRTDEEKSVAVETGSVVRLGRNAEGLEVFATTMGRFIRRDDGIRIQESDAVPPELFLRAPDLRALDRCADGYVRAMLMGEVQHTADLNNFLRGVLDRESPYDAGDYEKASTVIDAALVRFLNTTYETAQDAYGDANRLYDYLPRYRGNSRGKGAMPLPVAVIAQRVLGDTRDKRVLVPNAWDGASFAFLAQGTRIAAFRGNKDLSRFVSSVREEDTTWADRFEPAREQGAEGLFFNADPTRSADGQREDFAQALGAIRALNQGARAVLVLAGDEGLAPGEVSAESRRFMDILARRCDIESIVEVSAALTRQAGTDTSLRIISLCNRPAGEHSVRPGDRVTVAHSWDDLKSVVDEVIVTLQLREAQSEGIDVDRVAQDNDFQRPYLAFSKVGEAVTMVPKNLQGPLQYSLSAVESTFGPVDRFVEREMGFGQNTLGDRFSPEQVDALALCISRQKAGRGMIIGDETGIGKGRVLSGMATWANKQGKNVIFVTDRANLFSDLVRDLRDIEEWARFRPLMLNADGVLMDVFTNEVLVPRTPVAVTRDILQNDRTLADANVNLVFLTYSQIAGEVSPKAEWLLRRASDSLVIVDEAHVAAGSDSNTSQVITDLTTRAWGVVYSSATWAKTSENLHVYQRAMPETINMASLASTMRSGGESFSELFSSMLARDGAFVRREHDLSKIEFNVVTDTARLGRNSDLSDKVAEIMSAMTYVGGEINRVITRLNSETAKVLKSARAARDTARATSTEVSLARRRAAPAQGAVPLEVAPAEGALPAEGAPVEIQQPEMARGTLFRSHFGAGSVLYQVMRRFLAVLGTDHVTELAMKAIEENRKPVIVFEDTGESFVRKIIKDLTIPGVNGEAPTVPTEIPPPTIKDLLYGVMKRLGVVNTHSATELDFESALQRNNRLDAGIEQAEADNEVDVDAVLEQQDADSASGVVLSIADLPGVTAEQQKEYRDGIAKILELIDALPPIPLNAVDVLRARLEGAGLRVGEISGRGVRLQAPQSESNEPIESRRWTEFRWKLVPRSKKKSDVNNTVYEFNHGELDVLVINRSAATGLSLHASPRFGDTRRRELIESQIPANPTDRVQLYGRVNRYDQVVTPVISIPTTGIYGEVRQLMMQNKKLARLSANIRSSRDNAAEIKHVIDLLNPVGESVAKRYLLDNGGVRSRLGIDLAEIEVTRNTGTSIIEKLTARVALLRVKEQKAVYDDLYAMFEDELNQYELDGDNPLKAKELDLRAQTVSSDLMIGIEMDGYGSAFDGAVYLKEITWKEDRRPMAWRDAHRLIVRGRNNLLADGHAVEAVYNHPPIERIYERNVVYEDVDPATSTEETATMPDWMAAPGIAVLDSDLLPRTGFTAPVDEASKSWVHDTDSTPAIEKEKAPAEQLSDPEKISIQPVVDRLITVLKAKRLTELVGTSFPDVQAAIAAPGMNGIKRITASIEWLEKNLPNLVPGCHMRLKTGVERDARERAAAAQGSWWVRDDVVVVNLSVPTGAKFSQLHRWNVGYLNPDDSTGKVRQINLARLQEGKSHTETVNGVATTEFEYNNIIKGDIFEYRPVGVFLAGRQDRLERRELGTLIDDFNSAPRGKIQRRGHILDGNMYLASEWAQATKDGSGVIYTDERGLRHRAVLLKPKRGRVSVDVQSMPVRLWSAAMVTDFLQRVVDLNATAEANERGARDFTFDTTYKGAVGAAVAERPKLLIIPNKGVGLSMARADVTRLSRAMRSLQKRNLQRAHPLIAEYTPEQIEAAQSEMLPVKTHMARGKACVVYIDCDRARLKDAVELIVQASGIELYVPRHGLGRLAEDVQSEYFVDRRRAAMERIGAVLGAQTVSTEANPAATVVTAHPEPAEPMAVETAPVAPTAVESVDPAEREGQRLAA